MGQFNIAEVEGLEVLSLANNSVDYLSTNEKEQRQALVEAGPRL